MAAQPCEVDDCGRSTAPCWCGNAHCDVHPHTYTREEVSAALNEAADMLADEHHYESSETIAADDAANLLVSTALHLLDHPGASLDEAIAAQYGNEIEIDDGDMDDGEGVPEKGSPRWNQLVVARVKGWIA